MAYSLVTNVKTGGVNGGTSASVDTSGADLIVLWATWYDSVTLDVTVSDSKSNTWTALTLREVEFQRGKVWYAYAPSVGSGHTFTVAGTNTYATLLMSAWSGAAASPFDQQNGTANTNSVLSTGSVTPTEDNELVLAFVGFDNNSGGAVSVNASLSIIQSQAYVAATQDGASDAYIVQTSAGAVNPQWNITTSTKLAVAIATFKAASGGGGGGQPMMRRWGGASGFVGGKGIGQSGSRGGAWGRTREGIYVPRRFAA